MRIVIGVGGNALLLRHQSPQITVQRENVKKACQAIAKLTTKHQIILTHGNGPQVGLLALQAATYKKIEPYPFDVLGAESQGMIGYLLAQELKNQLPKKKIVVFLTQVEVDAHDPAFSHPEKFIGPVYTKKEAKDLAIRYQWKIAPDGDGFRRVVPSPLPKKILELEGIKLLTKKGYIVICAGGGGIPILSNGKGEYKGIEAVIDKDYTSVLLAEGLSADRLMLLTDVPFVMNQWRTANETPIKRLKPDDLQNISLASGSMKPKVSAACQFVKSTKKIAHIGLLSDAMKVIQQKTGTTIAIK